MQINRHSPYASHPRSRGLANGRHSGTVKYVLAQQIELSGTGRPLAPYLAPMLEVAHVVEQEQRLTAGAAEMPVVGRALLVAVGRADAGVYIEDHIHRRAAVVGLSIQIPDRSARAAMHSTADVPAAHEEGRVWHFTMIGSHEMASAAFREWRPNGAPMAPQWRPNGGCPARARPLGRMARNSPSG